MGEILTISEAASPPPGERQVNDFDSFSCSVQPAGTVHDIPCRSHLIDCPPASAAICSAVARPGSADPLELLELDPDGPELEFAFLNRSERLQSERAKPISKSATICFIVAVFYSKSDGKV
jgi:hypothetical protein